MTAAIVLIAILMLVAAAVVGVAGYVITGTWTLLWVFPLCEIVAVAVAVFTTFLAKWIVSRKKAPDTESRIVKMPYKVEFDNVPTVGNYNPRYNKEVNEKFYGKIYINIDGKH